MVDITEQLPLNTIIPTILLKLLSKVKIGKNAVQLALVTYSDNATVRFTFDVYSETNRADLQKSLSSYESKTTASIVLKALKISRSLFENETAGSRPSSKKIGIIISQFKIPLNGDDIKQADTMKNDGIELYTIGINTDESGFDVMSGLASSSFHIGINGKLYVDQIDLYIEVLAEQFKSIQCRLIT